MVVPLPQPKGDAPPVRRYYRPVPVVPNRVPGPPGACQPSVSSWRLGKEGDGIGPSGLPTSVRTAVACQNVVVCTSAGGGSGLSVIAALLSRTLHGRGLSCALVDADFAGGGLDLLLGIEGEDGLRFDTLDAPLGRIEGDALNGELPRWDGVRVLAFDPWNSARPDWWQVQAAVRALGEANQVVVIDAGRGDVVEHVPDLAGALRIIVVELSVLGLARAKAHVSNIRNDCDELRQATRSAGATSVRDVRDVRDIRDDVVAVGVMPRGAPRNSDVVDVADAVEYLGVDMLGPVPSSARLCADVLAGLGVRAVERRIRGVVDELSDRVERRLGRRREHADSDQDGPA